MPTTRQIFVNIPCSDVQKTTAFYESLGFTLNPMFSDQKASCLGWSESIYVMVLQKQFFESFIDGKEVIDAHKAAGTTLCITVDSREEVDDFAAKAEQAGGRTFKSDNSAAEQDAMYTISVEDPDGTIWEILYMDIAAFDS